MTRGILFVGEMEVVGVLLVALFSVGLESVKRGELGSAAAIHLPFSFEL